MAQYLSLGPLVLAVILLLYVAWVDFWTLKVRNASVLALLAVYLVFSVTEGFVSLAPDLFAAVLLFLLGLIFWLIGKMGAGDAKLFFPLGLFVGHAGLVPFAVGLIAGTFLLLLALRAPSDAAQGAAARRLVELRRTGRVPYAVPMVIGGLTALIFRIVAW